MADDLGDRVVLDASALLAFLQEEPGTDLVEERLERGAACSVVNWSEVAQKVIGSGRDWLSARTLLLSYELVVEPVTIDDAESAAHRWTKGDGLSIADRLCLALAERTDVEAWTADAAWGTGPGVRQIR